MLGGLPFCPTIQSDNWGHKLSYFVYIRQPAGHIRVRGQKALVMSDLCSFFF